MLLTKLEKRVRRIERGLLALAILLALVALAALASCEAKLPELVPAVVGPPAPPDRSAVVSWTAPATSADGSELEDLAGYRLTLSGPAGIPEVLELGVDALEVRLDDLEPGLHSFTLEAIDTNGNTSPPAGPVEKEIR